MRRLLLALLLSTVAACTTAPARPPVEDPEAVWARHQAALTELSTWHLTGSLAVRTGKEGGQGRIVWRQREARYDIRLSGPLGSGSLHLVGDEDFAVLSSGRGETVRSSDPELLLYRQLGWWIPVEALRYWVLGIPAPDLEAEWVLDPYGHLSYLEQAGWRVQFADYIPREGMELPSAVTVRNRDAEVRLVVRDWRLDEPRQQLSGFPPHP